MPATNFGNYTYDANNLKWASRRWPGSAKHSTENITQQPVHRWLLCSWTSKFQIAHIGAIGHWCWAKVCLLKRFHGFATHTHLAHIYIYLVFCATVSHPMVGHVVLHLSFMQFISKMFWCSVGILALFEVFNADHARYEPEPKEYIRLCDTFRCSKITTK